MPGTSAQRIPPSIASNPDLVAEYRREMERIRREQEATAQAARDVCTWHPVPGDRVDAGGACFYCGHWVPLHVGCDRCPVCELQRLNAAARHPYPSPLEHPHAQP
jgi:hypothetical protein